jgi:CheY-like chemotaxis protein
LSKLILIADDFENAAELLCELVKISTGFDTVAARDGREALRQARRKRPDAAVLDLNMPDVAGAEVAKSLRETFGEHRPLLIAYSGGLETYDVRRSGVFDYVLRKPADLPRLLSLLDLA